MFEKQRSPWSVTCHAHRLLLIQLRYGTVAFRAGNSYSCSACGGKRTANRIRIVENRRAVVEASEKDMGQFIQPSINKPYPSLYRWGRSTSGRSVRSRFVQPLQFCAVVKHDLVDLRKKTKIPIFPLNMQNPKCYTTKSPLSRSASSYPPLSPQQKARARATKPTRNCKFATKKLSCTICFLATPISIAERYRDVQKKCLPSRDRTAGLKITNDRCMQLQSCALPAELRRVAKRENAGLMEIAFLCWS